MPCGAVAQLGERLTGSQKAGGSSPPSSTTTYRTANTFPERRAPSVITCCGWSATRRSLLEAGKQTVLEGSGFGLTGLFDSVGPCSEGPTPDPVPPPRSSFPLGTAFRDLLPACSGFMVAGFGRTGGGRRGRIRGLVRGAGQGRTMKGLWFTNTRTSARHGILKLPSDGQTISVISSDRTCGCRLCHAPEALAIARKRWRLQSKSPNE